MCPGGAATTIECTLSQARKASIDHSIIGRPPRSTNAFGPPAPRRSPEPAAAMTAVIAGLLRGRSGGEPLLEEAVEVFLGAVLVLVERVHELRGKDLLRPGLHLLLA